jgi:tetratricopeptide (TPR) repeat protein/DNA-binding CsgD family transcriptional regulator
MYTLQSFYQKHILSLFNPKLSFREAQILSFIICGRSTKVISNLIDLSPKTIETHKRNLSIKLNIFGKEALISLIEKKGKIAVFQKFNQLITSNIAYEKIINSLSFDDFDLNVVFDKNTNQERALFEFLKKSFEKLNIKVNFNHSLGEPNENLLYLYYINDKSQLKNIVKKRSFYFGNIDKAEIPQEISNHYVCFSQDPYQSFLSLIKLLRPKENLENEMDLFDEKLEEDSEEKPVSRKKINLIICISSSLFLIILASVVFSLNKGKITKISNIFHRSYNHSFIYRPDKIKQIKTHLKNTSSDSNPIIGITGIGGSGKTILARTYLSKSKKDITWEFNTQNIDTLMISFQKLARSLAGNSKEKNAQLDEILTSNSQDKMRDKLFVFLKKEMKGKSWGFIFDNKDQTITDFNSYLPTNPDIWGKGIIIITSRDANFFTRFQIDNVVHLGMLTKLQQRDLFCKINKNENNLEKFLIKIPAFPLDTITAAIYTRSTNISLKNYLERLQKDPLALSHNQEILLKNSFNYAKTRFEIISLSLDKILSISKDFEDLLITVSLIGNKDILLDVLYSIKSPIIVDQFVFEMRKYSLLSEVSPEINYLNMISIHAGIQATIKHYVDNKLSHNCPHKIIEKILYHVHTFNKDKYTLIKSNIYIYHLNSILKKFKNIGDAFKGKIYSETGKLKFYLGWHESAIKDYKKSISHYRKCPGCHYNLSKSYGRLGNLYKEIDEHRNAKKCLLKAISSSSSLSMKEQSKLAKNYINYGELIERDGVFGTAKKYFNKGLELSRINNNPNDIAWALVHYAEYLATLGKIEESIIHINKAIQTYKDQKSYWYHNWAQLKLGLVYLYCGFNKKSLEILLPLLTSFENNNDYYHLNFIYRYIAASYIHLGELKKGREFLYKLKKIEKHLNHFSKWGEVYEGLCLIVENKYDKAISLLKNIEPKGKEQRRTIRSFLGDAYGLNGDYEKSFELLESVTKEYLKFYGRDSFYYIKFSQILGRMYSLSGSHEKGEKVLKNSLKNFSSILHPEKYTSYEYLSDIYFLKSKSQSYNREQKLQYLEKSKDFIQKAIFIAQDYLPKNSMKLLNLKRKSKEVLKCWASWRPGKREVVH